MVRNTPAGFVLVLVLSVMLGGMCTRWAHAGAWPQPTGKVQIIMTTSRKIAPVGGFFGDPVDEDSNATSLFAEYGVADELTVGITAYGNFSTTDADDVEARLGGHVRYLVWTGDTGDVISVQAGATFPVERWLGSGLGDSRPDSVPEVRLGVLYGRGWQTGWGDAFVSTELGYLFRGEAQDDEIRFDATAGFEPTRGLLGLTSVFTAVPVSGDGDTSLKISPSLAWTFWPSVGPNDKKPRGPINPNTLQLGLTWDALNPGDGLELFVSVWKGF
jgi:hypothetical protein